MTAGDNDRTTRTTDTIPVAPDEPVAEAAPGGNQQHRPGAPMVQVHVDGDDHDEPGYGYGV